MRLALLAATPAMLGACGGAAPPVATAPPDEVRCYEGTRTATSEHGTFGPFATILRRTVSARARLITHEWLDAQHGDPEREELIVDGAAFTRSSIPGTLEGEPWRWDRWSWSHDASGFGERGSFTRTPDGLTGTRTAYTFEGSGDSTWSLTAFDCEAWDARAQGIARSAASDASSAGK